MGAGERSKSGWKARRKVPASTGSENLEARILLLIDAERVAIFGGAVAGRRCSKPARTTPLPFHYDASSSTATASTCRRRRRASDMCCSRPATLVASLEPTGNQRHAVCPRSTRPRPGNQRSRQSAVSKGLNQAGYLPLSPGASGLFDTTSHRKATTSPRRRCLFWPTSLSLT